MGGPERILGVLPPLGGSLTDLARAGQLERLLHYYVPTYLEAFSMVRYFSYEPERLEDFTQDAELRSRLQLRAPRQPIHRHARALQLGVLQRQALRECSVVRVFQAPGAVPAFLAGVPYVCTYGYSYAALTGGGKVTRPIRRVALVQLLRVLLRRARVVLVANAEGEADALALGARRLRLVPNGVDVDRFAPCNCRDLHYDITFVGQLIPTKRVEMLVRAARHTGLPLRAAVVGDGPQRARLVHLATSEGIDVEFLGAVPNSAVAAILAESRCFVFPSEAEGHPKALIEALSVGVPCIAADIPAVKPFAEAGAVITFTPGDARALAGAIRSVLSDSNLRSRLSEASRTLVLERFDLRRLLALELDLLTNAASDG